jgi:oligopeptide transport system permease protein
MLKFIFKRILESVPVILIVITLTFFLVRMAPGGPFSAEKAVPAEILANLNARYHLNDPLWKQFGDYLVHLAQFDFGPSYKYSSRTVNEMIMTGLPVTAELGVYAIIVALIIGVFSGVMGALKPNTIRDYIPMSLSMIGICMPSFLLGPMLVLVFGIWLGWLPVSGWEEPVNKILPSITLGAAYAAYIARLSRGGMLEILSQDFIRTARAKGLPEKVVIVKHALKGGLLPVIAFLGPALAGLLSGSFVVETIFQIPGLGRFYVQAAFNRDYTMIMGTTVFLGVLIVFFNLLSDIIQVWLNPRLTY